MPSQLHELLLELFRNRPVLAAELLRDVLHVDIPAFSEARIESATLSDVVPAEYRADLVVLLVRGKPVLGIVVEVQLSKDPRKRFSWPVYISGLRARLKCACCLLVVCAANDIAKWAAEPISVGPGTTVSPLVVGPDGVPVIADDRLASEAPELAVLSALAHGHEPAVAISVAKAAVTATRGLDDDQRVLYWDLVYASVNDAAKRALEDLMLPEGYKFQSEFARDSFDKGKVAGQALGEAIALLEFLDARGVVPTDEQKQTILSCTDGELLKAWIRRAVAVSSIDELFQD